MDDRKFMEMAIEEATKSYNKPGKTPVYVGAVIVKDGQILAKAYRGENETGVHAEVTAIQKLGDKNLEGTTLYTTLEPCIIGSHPGEKYRWPCARWIVEKRIKKVWIGDLDPNPNICGRGVALLEENGITVEYFPSSLKEELKELNEEFIKKQKERPTIPLANRDGEKQIIWRFLNRLQLQDERYYGSRLLWFCGPPGIGKSELITWMKVVAEERNIFKVYGPYMLSDNPAILYFQQLSELNIDEIEKVRKQGASVEDYVCTAISLNLTSNNQPKIIGFDTDCHFSDLEGLANLANRLLSKLQHAPFVGIVIATREQPPQGSINFNFNKVSPLNLDDINKMCQLNRWQVPPNVVKELYNKSKGNPLMAKLYYASYVVSGKVSGAINIRDVLWDVLSHLTSPSQNILKKLSVALSGPYEEEEKIMNKETLLATVPVQDRALYEKALKELIDIGIVETKGPYLWMHDEIIQQVKKLLSEDEVIQLHYEFAQILKNKDPLGALWHLVSSKNVNEAIEILESAIRFSQERLLKARFIQTFTAFTYWFEDLIRLNIGEDTRSRYLFCLGAAYSKLAEVEAKAKNCKKA
ncbi:MAG TPA: hypothetical protein EYP60_06590, partial [bacterium (Candidatus Stahlbacteria)]|nr:hypothetical protein [Candidatus Stahlbacteria bacterium]